MYKRLLAGCLIALQVFLYGCSQEIPVIAGVSSYYGKCVTITDKGNYFDVVLDFTGGLSHKLIGEEFARGILQVVPDYETLVDSYIAQTCSKNQYRNDIFRVEDLRPQLNQDFKDEIDGMADVFSGGDKNERKDNKVSKDEIYIFNLFPDIARGTQCCFVSVFGSRSETHSTITGRNLDWFGGNMNELPGIQAIITFKYTDKKICSIGYLGFMGIITGFNDKKVFAAILDSQTGEPYNSQGKRSYPMDIRFALENTGTLNEAVGIMKDPGKHYATNHIIAFSDPCRSVVLENNFSGIGVDNKRVQRAVRTTDSLLNKGITWGIGDALGCVNSFVLYGNYDNHSSNKYNTKRWKNMKEQLLAAGPSVDQEGIKKVITSNHGSPGTFSESGDLYNRMTLQMILFQPESLTLEVFFHPRYSLKNPIIPVFEKIPVFQ